jgi:hypothetical protein
VININKMAETNINKTQFKAPRFHGLVPLMLFLILLVIVMIVIKLILK